jgi:hypothetical protein
MKLKRMRWVGHVIFLREMKNTRKILVGKKRLIWKTYMWMGE